MNEGRFEVQEGGADKGGDPIKRLVAPKSWGKYPYGINIKDLRDPQTAIPLTKAVAVYLTSFALTTSTALLFAAGFIGSGVAVGLAGAAILGFFYRGLECLVHGASHYDVHKNWTVNDWLADALMALPVLQTVKSFRDNHIDDHHTHFGYEPDPCRIRMNQHPDVQEGRLPTLTRTLKGLPREIKEFYRTAGASPSTLMSGLLWHAEFLVGPAALISGDLVAALAAWATIHAVTFFGTLPVVRALAETGEHDYAHPEREPVSQVERTFDNTGPLNSAIHPCGDKWHIEHHLFPGVPQYRLDEVHRRLIEKGYGHQMRHRITVLGEPEPFSEPVADAATDTNADAGEANRSKQDSIASNG